MQHEISEGFIRQIGKNYFMILTIDGQRQQRKTRTSDPDEAQSMLDAWKAEAKAGIQADTRLRYEDLRDTYIKEGGKQPQESILRDLDVFFKNIRVAAITVNKIRQFREYRESLEQVIEYKQETIEKETALRKLKAMNGRKTPLSPEQIQKIEAEAREWVENGVKATTDRRLTVLRAMFNFAAKQEKIKPSDIPASFCLAGKKVDNVRTNKFTEADFENILKELSKHLHPFVKFLYATGMRSGQAKNMTWDMIDENNHLVVPAKYTKNKKPFPLPLVNKKGKAYDFAADIVSKKNRPHGEPIFDTTNLRKEWRRACHKLGLGVFNEETESYRGAELHDFRRTAVSNMNAKGIARGAAMAVSGHKTTSMFDRYGIEDPKTIQGVFDRMGA